VNGNETGLRAVEHDQPPAGQAGGQRARDVDRDLRHARAVHDQRRRGHVRQLPGDVDGAGHLHHRARRARGDRLSDLIGGCPARLAGRPAQPLVRRGVGEQVPVLLDEAEQRLRLPVAHRVPAARGAAEQHHPPDPLRVARGVGDRVRARVVLAEEADLGGADLVDHRLQVRDHRVEREVGDVSLRVPGAPAVVVDHGQPPSELLEHRVQERVLPFHPQVAERHPRHEHQRGPRARDREGQAHTVRAARVADVRDRPHGSDCNSVLPS
jgi:hypothetical protein